MVFSLRRALLSAPLAWVAIWFALGACGETYIDRIDEGSPDAGDAPLTPDATAGDGGCTLAAALPAHACTAGIASLSVGESTVSLPLASSKIAITDKYVYAALVGEPGSKLVRFPKGILNSGSASYASCLGEVLLSFEGNALTELVDIATLGSDGICLIRNPASTGKPEFACMDGSGTTFRSHENLGGEYVASSEPPTSMASFGGRVFWTAKWPSAPSSPPPPPSAKAGSDLIFSYGTGGSARVEQNWGEVGGACGAHFDATAHNTAARLVAGGAGLAALGESTDNGGRTPEVPGSKRLVNCEERGIRTFSINELSGRSALSLTYENSFASLKVADVWMTDTASGVFALNVAPTSELAFALSNESGDVDNGVDHLVTNRAYRSFLSNDGPVLALPSGAPNANLPFVYTQQVGPQGESVARLRTVALGPSQGASIAATWAQSALKSDRTFVRGSSHSLVATSTSIFLAVVANQSNGCDAAAGYIARVNR